MKKFVLFSILFGAMSSMAFAQDDMYFTPTKKDKAAERESRYVYNDNPRNVDEYNRRGQFGSYYYPVGKDSLASDVIAFEPGGEESSDSVSVYDRDYAGGGGGYDPEDDYACSRMMSRFDGFYWYDPWYYGLYGPYWSVRYGWYDPWFYDPWYYGYGGWYGYYRPWGGWYYPHYWGGGYYRPYRSGVTGTRNHSNLGFGTARRDFTSNRNYNTNRPGYNTDRVNRNSYRNTRPVYSRPNNTNTYSRPSYNSSSFGGSRSFGGGSFGGSRGGGGHFGGRR